MLYRYGRNAGRANQIHILCSMVDGWKDGSRAEQNVNQQKIVPEQAILEMFLILP